jgi:hypothetical protein
VYYRTYVYSIITLFCVRPGLKHLGKSPPPPVQTAGENYRNPCISYDMNNYLAQPEVLKAFHVEPNTTWYGCSEPLFFTWKE